MARLGTRIRKLESRAAPKEPKRIWLSHAGEDTVTGPDGEVLPLDEFRRLHPDAVHFVLQYVEGGAR